MGRKSNAHEVRRGTEQLTGKIQKKEITLLVFTKDNLERLDPLIRTTSWIQNRIAIDMCSNDGTAEKLQEAGFEVHSIERETFVDELRNRHLSLAKTRWTLILDSDEFLADDAEEQILGLLSNARDNVAGFSIPRHNYFLNKKLTGSGWYPDHQLRLFRSEQIVYSSGHHKPPRPKDESMIIEVGQAPSCLHIHHNNYPNMEEFLRRQLHYALTDEYEEEPGSFDFDDYMLRAIKQFNLRYEGKVDGDISYVTGLVMYWDQIVRGLIHWERTGYQGHLSEHIPNQVFVAREFANANQERLDSDRIHRMYKNSLSWRLTAPLRYLNSKVMAVFRPLK
jgi:hypothetical protein